jgi:phosphosulfolactate phosphohydrolase-like enzyme
VATARAFSTPMEALLAARNGKALDARGWREQIEWCSQVSRFGMVGAMSAGIIRPL